MEFQRYLQVLGRDAMAPGEARRLLGELRARPKPARREARIVREVSEEALESAAHPVEQRVAEHDRLRAEIERERKGGEGGG